MCDISFQNSWRSSWIWNKAPTKYHTSKSELSAWSIKLSTYFYHIHILILSFHQHGYPWSSLANPPNRSSLLAGPQGYTPYPHGAAVCRFELIALLLLGHEGVHRSTSFMSSFLLPQQCPACLVRLTLIVFVIGGRRPYSCCFVGCCLQV